MLLLFCGPMETHSSWTEIHLQCWLGHMQFTAGIDQSLGKLTAMQIMSVSLAFAIRLLLLSHNWWSSRPPPREYGGKILLGRSCGCWWNLLLISMIIFYHWFWEKCASWMEFCPCLTPFISLTSSLKLTWLQFSHHLTSIRWKQCPSYCDWQSVPVLWREHQMWHILKLSLSSLMSWCSWWLHGRPTCMLCTFFCFSKLSPTAWSSIWLKDQWASIFWVRQDFQSHRMFHHQPWRLRSLAQEPGQ